MARLNEDVKETLRNLTVLVLLDLRAAYLAAGASPLRHWDQLLDRLRAAARTSAGVEEWHSAMCRSLQLPAPSSSACSALDELVMTVGPLRSEWLDLLEREHGYLLAKSRLEAERRRDARDANAKGETGETMEGER